VALIQGKYKYLLGTQRDLYRLQTREVTFTCQPLECFNDLYQLFGITTTCQKSAQAKEFIDYVLQNGKSLQQIGMLYGNSQLYQDDMAEMKKLALCTYQYKIDYALSKNCKKQIMDCVQREDIEGLKSYLKQLN
jgi:hypothetical protein